MTIPQKCTYRVETSEQFKEKLNITDRELLLVVEEYVPDETDEKITIDEIKQNDWVVQVEKVITTPIQLVLIDVLHERQEDYVVNPIENTLLVTEIRDREN